MAGYGVATKRERNTKRPDVNICSCGNVITMSEVLCQACKDDVFFAARIAEIEQAHE